MVVLQHGSGDTYKLEARPDALILWHYKPGTRRPRQTRVPKAQCQDGSVQAELERSRQEMLDKGFWESPSDDEQSETQALSLSFTVEGGLEKGHLPQDLQRVTTQEGNALVLRPEGLNTIELPVSSGSSRRLPNSSGIQSTLEGLVTLLRIQDAIARSESTASMRIVNAKDADLAEITLKNVLKHWPELEPSLEEHELLIHRLKSPEAFDWFF